MSYHHLVYPTKDIEERVEDLVSKTTERLTPKLFILRTQVGRRAVYSAIRISTFDNQRDYWRLMLWRYHKKNLLNYTDLNRNQFFIYGDQ